MKKTYIEPSVKAVEIKNHVMQSASVVVDPTKEVNTQLSVDAEFDDNFNAEQ